MPKIKRAAEDSSGNVSFSVMPWKAKRKLEGAVPETLTTSDGKVELSQVGVQPIPMGTYTCMFPKPEAAGSQANDLGAGSPDSKPGQTPLKPELHSLLEAYSRNLEPQEAGQNQVASSSEHSAPGHMIFFADGTVQGGAKDVEDGTQLRVRGSMIQSGRDCLRDDDWQVFQLCISEEGKGAVRMLAGKSGGDAAKLEAPLETHGTEEEDFKHQLAGSSNRGSLSFHCSVVYEGSKSVEMQKDMGVAGPSKEAIVNAGDFTWDLQLGNGFIRGLQKPDMLYDSDLDSW